jgi:hypothetical protein
MSDDQLNDKLKKRIKAVFGDYEDDTAEEGWLLLREKFPNEKEDRPVAWLWRMAAIAVLLLAFLGIGLWFNFNSATNQKIVVKNKNTVKELPAIAKNDQHLTNSALITVNRNTPKSQTTSPVGAHNNKINYYPVNSNANNTITAKLANKAKSLDIIDSPATVVNKQSSTFTATVDPTEKDKAIPAEKDKVSPAEKDQAIPAEINKTMVAKQPDHSIQSLFDNDKNLPDKAEQKNTNKRVIFAIYAATYVNYAKGSNKQFNTGGGFTSDIRITDNLSLSTGVAIAQNSLGYNSASSPLPTLNAALTRASFPYYAASFNETGPSSQELNASLINLDVPVNLKYVFNPEKKNIYVAAGLSSGTFINETYNYVYNYSGSNSTSQESQVESTHKAFDSFYFASMLNLSFGVGYPLGKNQLIIEPFLKYPVNGLGDQHILFGSGGLNLKINFGSTKK